MMGISLGFYWKFCLGFFVPFALLGIFVFFIVTYEPLTYQVSSKFYHHLIHDNQ